MAIPLAWFLKRFSFIFILICFYCWIRQIGKEAVQNDQVNNRYHLNNVEVVEDVTVSDKEHGETQHNDSVLLNIQSDSDGCKYRGLTTKVVFSGNLRVSQDDSKLLGFVRKCIFTPPSPLAYNLADPTGDPSAVQGVRKYVSSLLGNKRNGVYIEFGANDGEDISNTLVLERDFGWSGLLIEADPMNAEKLLEKHRKAWVANVCAGIHPYPYEIEMYRNDGTKLVSRLAEGGFSANGPEWSKTKFKVPCLPLYTMMCALNLKDLDYMSMDIEGAELNVLNTLPFDKIKVKVFSIETMPENWDAIRAFMHSKGYAFVKSIRGKYIEDDVFAHTSLLNGTTTQGVFTTSAI